MVISFYAGMLGAPNPKSSLSAGDGLPNFVSPNPSKLSTDIKYLVISDLSLSTTITVSKIII